MWYTQQKRFDLKRSALDIKEEKLGQFSVCRGGKARLFSSPFFDKGRGAAGRRGEMRGGQALSLLTPTVNS